MKARIELRCKRDLEVSSEVHLEAVLLVPGQEERILVKQILDDEDVLGCVIAELEDDLREIPGVQVGSVDVTGLDNWEWETKTPGED